MKLETLVALRIEFGSESHKSTILLKQLNLKTSVRENCFFRVKLSLPLRMRMRIKIYKWGYVYINKTIKSLVKKNKTLKKKRLSSKDNKFSLSLRVHNHRQFWE